MSQIDEMQFILFVFTVILYTISFRHSSYIKMLIKVFDSTICKRFIFGPLIQSKTKRMLKRKVTPHLFAPFLTIIILKSKIMFKPGHEFKHVLDFAKINIIGINCYRILSMLLSTLLIVKRIDINRDYG